MRFDDYLHQHQRWNYNDAFAWFCYKNGVPNKKFSEKHMLPGDEEAIRNGEFIYNLVETRESLDITDMMPHFKQVMIDRQMKDIDGVNAPWTSTFVEWDVDSSRPIFDACRGYWGVVPHRIGVAVLCIPGEDYAKSLNMRRQVAYKEIKQIPITEEEVVAAWRKFDIEPNFTDEVILSVKWHICFFPFILTNFGVLGPVAELKGFLDEDGKFLIAPPSVIQSSSISFTKGEFRIDHEHKMETISLWPEWSYPTNDFRAKIQHGTKWMESERSMHERAAMVGFIAPVFFAFHYLNYRNIVAGKVPGRYDSPREAKNRPPARSYHILKVRPISARKSASRPFSEVIGNMPLHTVAGCHHRYGPKYGRGLLFGKYEGKFWVAPHVRGNARSGIVNKDYELVGS
jgi:hypothetical protein